MRVVVITQLGPGGQLQLLEADCINGTTRQTLTLTRLCPPLSLPCHATCMCPLPTEGWVGTFGNPRGPCLVWSESVGYLRHALRDTIAHEVVSMASCQPCTTQGALTHSSGTASAHTADRC
jgi:hypothetical protein